MGSSVFAIWSPHRDSNCINAFKVMLGLRSEHWVWCNDAHDAAWWVVDGTRPDCAALTAALHQERLSFPSLRGAMLAPDWSAVKDPVWTFFKVPLQSNHIFNWIDANQPKRPRLPTTLDGMRFKLLRWPNMSRYARLVSMNESMKLTLACSRLLKDWASYEEVQAMVSVPSALDVVLRDAYEAGILERIEAPVQVDADFSWFTLPSPLSDTSANAPEYGPWSLVKRLLQKFA